MRTFGVRTLPRALLLVDTDPEETFSAMELERFHLRLFSLREPLLMAMPSEISSGPSPSSSLSLTLQKLPFSLITIAATIYSTHTPVLPPIFVATPMPLLARFCPIPALTTTAAVFLQTACFAVTIVSCRPPLFIPSS